MDRFIIRARNRGGQVRYFGPFDSRHIANVVMNNIVKALYGLGTEVEVVSVEEEAKAVYGWKERN